ncbi:MAG: hypothetical protein KC492_27365, partial [Myxococcales bacterium]|nr:hypothetical protein [Myxococcales bacterium]
MRRILTASLLLSLLATFGCDGGSNEVLDNPDGGSGASGGNGNGGSGGNGGGGSGGAAGTAGGNSGGTAGTTVNCPDGTANCPELSCAPGYTCTADPDDPGTVWVMKDDGNVNGPSCQKVCERALPQNCSYYACDDGRSVNHKDMASFGKIAEGLGFECREGGCWDSVSPTAGQVVVSIDTDANGAKSCYFP